MLMEDGQHGKSYHTIFRDMIICEIGLNHNGDVEYANEYLNKIIESKADGVLFHVREKSFYKESNHSKFLLPDQFYIQVFKKLKSNNIKCGVSISDITKIPFFIKNHIDFFKVFSKDIKDFELISSLKSTGKKIFISTGMSDIDEITKLVNFIGNDKNRFTLIHTQLTHDLDHVNLKAISMLEKKFGMSVAYGNHCINTNVLYLSLVFEPSDIIFYIKGNQSEHLDELHAIVIDELPQIVRNLKELPRTLGNEVKINMPNKVEKKI